MIQALRGWIITICTAVFFITAVEIILPDNSLKKYAKFVLGLILIMVFINPIVKLFDKDFNINTYTNNTSKYFDNKKSDNDFKQYKESSLKNTVDNFKLNLQQNCEKKLKEKYPDSNYEVQVDAAYDNDKQTMIIKSIKVGVKEGTIEKIQQIKIGKDSKSVNNSNDINNEKSANIVKYLSDELEISKDIIQIYKV